MESAGGDSRRVLTGGLGRCANEEEHFPLGAPRLLAVTKYIPIRQKLLACRAGACAYIELLSVHVWTRMPTRSTTSLPTPHGALFLWKHVGSLGCMYEQTILQPRTEGDTAAREAGTCTVEGGAREEGDRFSMRDAGAR